MAVKTKKTVKKAPTKKATVKPAKKATSAKSSAKPAVGKITVGDKAFTKSELISTLIERTGHSRKEMLSVFNTISEVIEAHLRKNGPETFTWPGLMKIMVVKKPATKARKGINPFTGEETTFKAKPASRKVKIRPLRGLKEMAS